VKDLFRRDTASMEEVRIQWDGTNDRGERLASGVYVVRHEGNLKAVNHPFLLIR
jgi:flagellar hook assembly protein FlgD